MALHCTNAGVVGLYISYAVPVFFHALASRGEGSNWVPGPFSLGGWSRPLALISSAWICLACALFVLPQVRRRSVLCRLASACCVSGLCVTSVVFPAAAQLHRHTPQVYPVTSRNLNYAPVTVGCVVVIAGSLWLLSARNWFEGPVGDPNVSCASSSARC
jgi:hypothetical protein